MKNSPTRIHLAPAISLACASALCFAASGCNGGGGGVAAPTPSSPARRARRTSRDLRRSRGRRANRDSNTVTVLRVRDAAGSDHFEKLAEVAVGVEP
jgi:hypothetical protein